jgi:CSLREA domain-containing protein
MSYNSPIQKILVSLNPARKLRALHSVVHRQTLLGFLLALGLLVGGTARALSHFDQQNNSNVSFLTERALPAAHHERFYFEPRDIDASRVFLPASAFEMMKASRWGASRLSSLFNTITVNTTADTSIADGFCSLREAITAANTDTAFNGCAAGEGPDVIVFALGAGTPIIDLLAPLPAITASLEILGDMGGATRVGLNGASAGAGANGLEINSSTSGISGLVINNFSGAGVILNATGELFIKNSYIGTNAAGTAAAGNGVGIVVNNTVESAIIGAETVAAEGNVISGNLGAGILLSSGARSVEIAGNLIGLNAAGNAAVPNATGIQINVAFYNTIGGTEAIKRNVISGNNGHGIQINGSSDEPLNNQVLNNVIGRNQANTANIPNTGSGVWISGLTNFIGDGTNGNIIAGNSQNGVTIAGGTFNQVLGNSIFSNTGLGIDLVSDGVTPNDDGDGDGGPNGRQNYPIINSVTAGGTVSGTINTLSFSLNVRIEFFANTTCDSTGYGEGEVFLGSTDVFVDGSGNAEFTFDFTPIAGKPFITATATSEDEVGGITSEFSACRSACTYSISPTTASFQAGGGSGTVNVMAGSGCTWAAVSDAPTWLTISSGASGTGNGTVTYSVAANPSSSPRSGTLTIAGETFTVTQIAQGAIIVGEFTPGSFPPAWEVVDGGTPATYYNINTPVTWTTSNPCNEVIPSPFVGTFAIVDASCTDPEGTLDEELRLPPFDATGLGSVFVEFYSQFQWDASAPNNKGDVDVSTDGGLTWTNVLRLENGDDGVPTPVLKSLNITPYITANPSNVLVRLRYYGMTPPASLIAPSLLAAAGGKVSWAVDFGVYSYTLTPNNQSFSASGGEGSINVATSPAINMPQGEWTAVSNNNWITIHSGGGPNYGNGTVTYSVAANTGPQRSGTITASGRIFTVTQAGGNNAPTITGAAINTTQAAASSQQQIATVNDTEDVKNTLQITISSNGNSFSNTATINGVTITLTDQNTGAPGNNPNALGQVLANVQAACGATNASFTVKVTDSGGGSATATLAVTVIKEGQAPTIVCPANQVGVTNINAPTTPIQVTWTAPVVSDNCTGATASCTPQSGSLFPLGVTTVTCKATDQAGNISTCSFTVTVRQPRAAITNLNARVQTYVPPLTQAQANQLRGHLELANTRVEQGQIAQACTHMQNFVNQVNAFTPSPLSATQAQDLISYANKIRNALNCTGGPFAAAAPGRQASIWQNKAKPNSKTVW